MAWVVIRLRKETWKGPQSRFLPCAVHKAWASKHLKGQLAPRVSDVTFLDQMRSVGAPRQWRHVFGSRRSVGAPCQWRHVFGSQEVSWDPASVTSHFWIKGRQLGPCVSDVTFLDQKRSVGAPRQWRYVFGSRRSVGALRQWRYVFGSKEVSWGPTSVTSRFWINGGQLDPPFGFWLVSMFFQGSFMVFHGFWLVSMVYMVVFGWFPWFTW